MTRIWFVNAELRSKIGLFIFSFHLCFVLEVQYKWAKFLFFTNLTGLLQIPNHGDLPTEVSFSCHESNITVWPATKTLQRKQVQGRWTQAKCLWCSGKSTGSDHSCCKESWTEHKRDQRTAFILDKQLSWSTKYPSLQIDVNVFLSQSDQHGRSVFVAKHNTEYKTWATNGINFVNSSGLELASTHVLLPRDWGCPALWQWVYRAWWLESSLYCDPTVHCNCYIVLVLWLQYVVTYYDKSKPLVMFNIFK